MSSNDATLAEPLETRRLHHGQRQLIRDLVIRMPTDRWHGQHWRVESDTVTDFSSMPGIGRALIPWYRVDIAGVVHDALYRASVPPREGMEPVILSRAAADDVWWAIARSGASRASRLQAFAGWLALRLFGGLFWSGANLLWHRTVSSVAALALLAGIGVSSWYLWHSEPWISIAILGLTVWVVADVVQLARLGSGRMRRAKASQHRPASVCTEATCLLDPIHNQARALGTDGG